MALNVGFLLITVLKIAGLLAWVYGLLWGLGQRTWLAKLATIVAAFAVIQLAIGLRLGPVVIFSDFDSGLLFQACTMAMVALGLNLIYGFNGQFSLGQWGFYGIGAYAAADITYRWTNDDARGLLVAGIGARGQSTRLDGGIGRKAASSSGHARDQGESGAGSPGPRNQPEYTQEEAQRARHPPRAG